MNETPAEKKPMSEKEKAEGRFEEWYAEGIRRGEIPLEFAGPAGKKVLNEAFHCGCGFVVFRMIKAMLEQKVGKPT